MKKYILRHKGLLVVNIISVILVSFLQAYQAILFQDGIDRVTGVTDYDFRIFIMMCIGFLIALMVIETFSKRSSAALNKAIMSDYKQNIIEKFISTTNQKRVSNSEFISVLNNDIKIIEDSYLKSFINIFKDGFLFLVSIVLLLRINIKLTIIISILSWSLVFIPQLFSKKNQRLKEGYSKNLKSFTERIKEVAQGFEVIKGFNIEDKIKRLTTEENSKVENSKFKSDYFEGFIGAVAYTNGMALFFVAIIIGGYLVMNDTITVGEMIAMVQLMNYIVNPLITISMYKTKIDSVSKIIEKIESKIININTEEVNGIFDFNNEIKIKELNYSYDGQVNTLENINLSLEKGKKYLLVGESGSGKTTLLKILLKQITNYIGNVEVDNNEIRKINSKSFYEHVTLIGQKVFMFKDSIRNNICLYGECNEEKLEEVVRQSGLSKLIEKLPEGLDTIIGEDAKQLSGGEFQRIAIARSLIKNSEILLVDEATSSLDKVISMEIEKTLVSLNKTIITITHKLEEEILKKYDEIIVMKDGKITEKGSFDDLLGNKGYFYYMYNFK